MHTTGQSRASCARSCTTTPSIPPARPAGPGSPAAQVLGWAQQASLSIDSVSEPAVLRAALEALTFRPDGSRAAANTIIRKRAVLHGALGYAAKAGLLPDNPLDSISWQVPQSAAALNPAVVASPAQVSALLARIVSTVLFVLAATQLQGENGVLSVFLAWLTCLTGLTGLAVVWLLWRPPSRAFFVKRYPLRADHAGITLGPQRYPLASRPATFVPWADVEQIILYTGYQDGTPAPWIGIRRREAAPALPSGNQQDPSCPVPGVAAGAARRNKGLRLDRERLAAVTAAVAPAISVVEAGVGPGSGVTGPGRTARRLSQANWALILTAAGVIVAALAWLNAMNPR